MDARSLYCAAVSSEAAPVAIIGATGALGFGLALRSAARGRARRDRLARRRARAEEAAGRAREPRCRGAGPRDREPGRPRATCRRRVPLRAVPQPVREPDEPQGRAHAGPAARRRDRPARGRRRRQGDARARRLAGLGRPAGGGDGRPTACASSARCTPSAPRRSATSTTRSTRTCWSAATAAADKRDGGRADRAHRRPALRRLRPARDGAHHRVADRAADLA